MVMTPNSHRAMGTDTRIGSPLQVLLAFLKLGVTCFGGPIAHIGYFREEFVCAGAGSTNKPMPIWWGCASSCPAPPATSGLPSASCGPATRGSSRVSPLRGGPFSVAQIAAILLGAIAGLWLCRAAPPPSTGHIAVPVSRTVGLVALTAFFLLLAGLPVLRDLGISQGIALFEAFYRSGALVFGGGHVVLPLLREAFVTPGWVSDDTFLAGYGAAQAVPGPLFTFAAYLGAIVSPSPHGLAGAALGLIAIFLPGVLILIGTLPFWETFRKRVGAQAMMRGVNAAVVGLLGAALYNPLWTSSVRTPGDFGIALVGFVLLTVWRAPPLVVVVVVISALGGIALAQIVSLGG